MADLFGLRNMGPLGLQELIEGEQEAKVQQERAQTAKAEAYAHLCASLGIQESEMTAGQRELAEAIAKRNGGHGTFGKGYGFSIDTEGRKPNWK